MRLAGKGLRSNANMRAKIIAKGVENDDGGKLRELAELVGFDDGLINRPV